jgi:hypothetical protein
MRILFDFIRFCSKLVVEYSRPRPPSSSPGISGVPRSGVGSPAAAGRAVGPTSLRSLFDFVMGVVSIFAVGVLWIILHEMSTKCPRNVHEMSTKCPGDAEDVSPTLDAVSVKLLGVYCDYF